jgi:hypothetical protein
MVLFLHTPPKRPVINDLFHKLQADRGNLIPILKMHEARWVCNCGSSRTITILKHNLLFIMGIKTGLVLLFEFTAIGSFIKLYQMRIKGWNVPLGTKYW